MDLPVLVVWGSQDTWIPVDRAHRLAGLIPGARLRIIDGAGHLIQLDQPAALAVVLTEWLARQRQGRPAPDDTTSSRTPASCHASKTSASGRTWCWTTTTSPPGQRHDRGQRLGALLQESARCWCSRARTATCRGPTAEDSEAESPAEPPRLTRRPKGVITRVAAAATQPKTGSTTTSAVPSRASAKWAASASGSLDSGRRTTSSAPLRRARSAAASPRQTPTIRDRRPVARRRATAPGRRRHRRRAPRRSPRAQLGAQVDRRPGGDAGQADRGDLGVGRLAVDRYDVGRRRGVRARRACRRPASSRPTTRPRPARRTR